MVGIAMFCAVAIIYFLKNEIDKLDNRVKKLEENENE